MPSSAPTRLPVAAIRFLNPAPLMWDFEHPPRDSALALRYDLNYTQPAQCAADLHAGRAALGLIPIAALSPELAIVPGCTIASLDHVRSIQLIVKHAAGQHQPDSAELDPALRAIRTIAADTASRSSVAYAQVLFQRFLGTSPTFVPAVADSVAMLQGADAALLIGDPALLALENRTAIEAAPGVGPCLWIDLAHQWRLRTGLPWVAAVWAVQPAHLSRSGLTPAELIADLQGSRDAGLSHLEDLVTEWSSRIALAPSTIRHYLTHNIQYSLTPDCVAAIELFRRYAAEVEILPPLTNLRFL